MPRDFICFRTGSSGRCFASLGDWLVRKDGHHLVPTTCSPLPYSYVYCPTPPDMRFVKKITPPDFQAKTFAPLISPKFDSFGDKNTTYEWKRRKLHRWQNFYTAVGSDGTDKSHLWWCLQQFFPFPSYSAQWGVPKPNWIVLSNIYNTAAEPVLFLEWNGVQYRLERCRGSLTHFKPAKQGHD